MGRIIYRHMEHASSIDGQPAKALLGKGDPPPVEVYNPTGAAPMVIVCDHASRRVPAVLGDMGLAADAFEKHIAFDIGAEDITRRLADRLHAPAVIAGYSRLVVDVNRQPGDPQSIPVLSDNIAIPANQGLSPEGARQRIDEIFNPYHETVDQLIASLWQRDGNPPALFSIHSFTPSMSGENRKWDISVLWNRDPRMAEPLIQHLRNWEGLHVGDNVPYSGRELAYTIDRHGTAGGLPTCAIEIRQDHCATVEEAAHWADIITDALHHILSLEGLHTVQRF